MERVRVGIGYDLQGIGGFKTKDIMHIYSRINNRIIQNNQIVCKRVGPKNNMIHSMYMSFGIDL
jgi:hypothetical protein